MPRFVVQHHAATRRHFDLRLQAGGVAKSWAVPRGPSLRPAERRLAVPVPDHDLAALDREGRDPGGGATIVWDTGTYRWLPDRSPGDSVEDALAAGHLAFCLRGTRLRGGFALTRTAQGEDERWILVKMRDEHADPEPDPAAGEPTSVLSGRTLDDLLGAG